MKTIVAIATGNINSGISIVRVSGKRAFEICQHCMKIKIADMEDRKMYLTTLDFGGVKDKSLVVKFVSPKSFTGEDIFEFHLHGGFRLAQCVVDFLISKGASLASPGEFSKRAFLNGKLSLEEAEGVIDLINAESKAELNAGYALMVGKLNKEIEAFQNELTNILAEIEVSLDYPEEDIEYIVEEQIVSKLKDILSKLIKMQYSSKTGSIIKNGLQVAIIGKPNVGKSSLLNAMLNCDRAIVTDIAGTTRDTVEGSYEYKDIKVCLWDTAGIRESDNEVEKIGIGKSIELLRTCDVILFLTDGSRNLDKEDEKIFTLLKDFKDKPIILVSNKKDLQSYSLKLKDMISEGFENSKIVEISAKENDNVLKIKEEIYNIVLGNSINLDALYITNSRHLECVNKAIKYLQQAISQVYNISLDCISLDIKNAWNSLGEITGKNITEEVITQIFEKFCLGK